MWNSEYYQLNYTSNAVCDINIFKEKGLKIIVRVGLKLIHWAWDNGPNFCIGPKHISKIILGLTSLWFSLLGPNPTPKPDSSFLQNFCPRNPVTEKQERKWRKMAELSAGGEIPSNMTIYINNLNEKIKLEGDSFVNIHSCFSLFLGLP